jgi:site-specific recombinase XerD
MTVMLINGDPIETVGQMSGYKKLATTQLYAWVTNNKVQHDMKVVKKKYTEAPLFLSYANQ